MCCDGVHVCIYINLYIYLFCLIKQTIGHLRITCENYSLATIMTDQCTQHGHKSIYDAKFVYL